MGGYGIFLLPLISQLKFECPIVASPWYADNGAIAGTLKIILYFKRLCEIGPDCEYFPKESKRLLIVRSKDSEKAEFSSRTIITIS